MRLSVIILSYNVRYFLELCLQSVKKATSEIHAEIIVIDNNSSDESCSMIRNNYPEVILIENKVNLGFSKANNQAIDIANGKYVCIINPDTVIPEDTFKKILNFSDSKNDLGIVGCRFIDGSGNFLPECKRKKPTLFSAFLKIIGVSRNYYAIDIDEKQIAEVPILTGAFMLMKNKLFKDLRGFDENFFMYGEDIDLSFRALKMNKINYYYGDVTIIHFKGESTIKNKEYYRRFFKAMELFYNKHYISNFITKSVFKFIMKLLPLINSTKASNKKSKKQLLFLNPHFNSLIHLNNNYKIISSKEQIPKHIFCDLVLDSTSLTFTEIINTISELSNNRISFKIWPKKTSFLIGSENSYYSGDVLHIS